MHSRSVSDISVYNIDEDSDSDGNIQHYDPRVEFNNEILDVNFEVALACGIQVTKEINQLLEECDWISKGDLDAAGLLEDAKKLGNFHPMTKRTVALVGASGEGIRFCSLVDFR
jgi:hypothetical protein